MVDDRDIVLTLKELDDMLADPRLSPAQLAKLMDMRMELEDLVEDVDPRLLAMASGAMS
ncbi:hypothetical protein SuNHUV7_05400 (plasmid) [Pseudoseohaeicola sp. NH-UV-7]|uniref:hypothetical protein n=1 Tax=Sulfitobacter sp. TBRI5 TaxID=2989732 RepID=UPI003A722389